MPENSPNFPMSCAILYNFIWRGVARF